MRIRFSSLKLLLLMGLFSIVATVFLSAVGQAALNDEHEFQFFADSSTYHKAYAGGAGSFDGQLVGVASNYLGPLVVLEILAGNIYLVMLLNVCIFCWSILRITALLRIDPLKVSLLLLLSPITISTLLSVNKEIFVFPFLALALTAYLHKSTAAAVLALVVSIMARWQLTAFYAVLLSISGLSLVKDRKSTLLLLLFFLSALYMSIQSWIEPIIAYVEFSTENYDGGGSGLFEALLGYQKSGLYFLVFPLKAMHLLFAMGVKFDKLFNPVEIYNDLFVSGHCAVALIVFLVLLKRRLFSLSSDLIFSTVTFLAVFCLTPVFAPRYLYFVFVVWVLVLAGAQKQLPQRMKGNSTKSPAKFPTGSAALPVSPGHRQLAARRLLDWPVQANPRV